MKKLYKFLAVSIVNRGVKDSKKNFWTSFE